MAETINSQSRVVDVTLGQLADFLRDSGFVTTADVAEKKPDVATSPKPDLIGLQGLADYLQMSKGTAWKYYKAGVFDNAVVKVGDRNLRFDMELASEAVRKKKRRKG